MAITKSSRIFVAGHRGMVGQAVLRRLKSEGYEQLQVKARAELDLRQGADVQTYFAKERPEAVILCAAKVGGIVANASDPVGFLEDNALISINVISAAARFGVRRLIYLGSSCIYPKFSEQPISEQALLTGALEPTNEAYALAKITGAKLCEYYRRQQSRAYLALMPTNLYGLGDNFDLQNSHVVAALVRKVLTCRALGRRDLVLWGDGTPRREFLHVDDLSDAIQFVLELKRLPEEATLLNVGWGRDISIRELAELITELADWPMELHFDTEKPNGTPRKLLDTHRMATLGWTPKVQLRDGLRQVLDQVVQEGLPDSWAATDCEKAEGLTSGC